MIKQSRSPLQPAAGLWGGNNPARSSAQPAVAEGVVLILRQEIVADGSSDSESESDSRSTVLLHISVADPSSKLKSVTLELAGHWKGDCAPVDTVVEPANTSVIHVVLPAGADAGNTVSLACHS